MDDSRHRKLLADPVLLDLLHREAEGDLNPGEQAQLDERKDDPDVQSARTALRRAVMFLSGPNPPLPTPLIPPLIPRSIAADVVAEIHLSRHLNRIFTSPPLPRSIASSVAAEVALSRQLAQTAPPLPRSVAAVVASDIAAAAQLTPPTAPRSLARSLAAQIAQEQLTGHQRHYPLPPAHYEPDVLPQADFAAISPAASIQANEAAPAPLALMSAPLATPASQPNPAPFLLVGGLLLGVTLLALTTAWPNLAAGAMVVHTLLTQVSPLAGAGLTLLLLTSVLVTWKPVPAVRIAGAGAFAVAAALTIPALYGVAGNGLSIGHNVTVSGPVTGNVIAIGGNVHLLPSAQVSGQVVTLLGDIKREQGAQVSGQVSALLGHIPGDHAAIQTHPVSDLSLATAAAFRPVLGWLGAAAWPRIFVALTGSLLLLLYLSGMAPTLARRQRHAPMQTLALGILLLFLFSLPALGLALSGYLGLALLVSALATLLAATGLSVSIYDAGRALAYRLHLPLPDAVGAMLGLCAFAASQSYGLLAFALTLVGGAWGAGTLLLSQRKTISAESC